jgi:hypothetical protein
MTAQPSLAQINRKLKNSKEISLAEKIVVYQAVSRVWRRHLTQAEIVTVTYIVDRTIGWGKNHFTASFKNVLYGTDRYSGIGLPERTYFRALKTLQEKGLIERKSRRDRTTIALKVDWLPPSTEVSPAVHLLRFGEVEESQSETSRTAFVAA